MKTKRPDAAANAITKTKYIQHGGRSSLLSDPLDMRTALGRTYSEEIKALEAHLGGELSLPQQALVEQAVRLSLLASIAWAEILRKGLFPEGAVSPAFEVFSKASKDAREILKTLGLERKIKEVSKTLKEILDEDRNSD